MLLDVDDMEWKFMGRAGIKRDEDLLEFFNFLLSFSALL